MRHITHDVDFCVVGGGLAGLCAAVAAARSGITVALMQDRPVLGGNASSEIRMWVCGADGKYDRETGIVEELFLENYYRNHSLSFSVWDSVLYEKARFEPRTTLLLNCACQEAEAEGGVIRSVRGYQATSETFHTVCARFFADCSGDSVLAPLTGAEFMLGREAKSQYGEHIAPDAADNKTMGMSCLMQIRETPYPQTYIPPDWAYRYPDDGSLGRSHGLGTNFWWIELGGDRDSIHDTEELRDELLKITFGVWDHIKNRGDHGAENWALDWVGFLPGKRESRRYTGAHVLTLGEILSGGKFPDNIAYGGWSVDDHFPEGFYFRGTRPNTAGATPSPWGIPYRCIYSKNIENLLFAGRNISATHAAISSTRVMATCAILGQAAGTAAALAVRTGSSLSGIDVDELQQTLLYDDCFIPGAERRLSGLTKLARTNMPELKNGKDRDFKGVTNSCSVSPGEALKYEFDGYERVDEIRLVFDSDLPRNYDNMPCRYPLVEDKYKMPATLVKSYRLTAQTRSGEVLLAGVDNNRRRMVRHTAGLWVKSVTLTPLETYGAPKCAVFAMDLK